MRPWASAVTALLLAERGAKVVLGARGLDRLEALAARIADAGGEAACVPTDVRQRDDLSLPRCLCSAHRVSPGFTRTNLAESMTDPEAKAQIVASMEKFAMPPDAVARAIAFAIEQPPDVDVGEIIVRPTAQG